ncbi:hypothetical protein LSPCS325_00610 [Lysinibacillus sp. CTST325]
MFFLEKLISADWYKKSINDRKLAMRENEFSDDFSEEEEELLEKNEALETQTLVFTATLNDQKINFVNIGGMYELSKMVTSGAL